MCTRTLTFTPPEEYRYTGSGMVLAIERPRQIPVIEARLDSVPGTFGIDTGARSALLLYGPYCERNQLASKFKARGRHGMGHRWPGVLVARPCS